MAYGRDVVGLKRIIAITSPDNEASGRLLEAVGLRFERNFDISADDRSVRLYGWGAEPAPA